MKPVKLFAENFKALDFQEELKPVTMFTGPNESGKTARLDAIKVALLGYHPSVGKQPSATITFAGESRAEMTVHLEFDNKKFITRTFKRNAKGEVSRSNKGDIPEIPPVLFDASDYLEDTAAGRIKTVFERIDVSQIAIKDEDLIERLNKIEAVPAAVSVVAVKEMIDEVQKTITRRGSLKQTPQLWLEELVKRLTDLQKGEKNLMDNASSQLQTLRPASAAPKSAAAEIAAAKTKLAELEQKKNEIESALANYQKTEARRESLRKQIAAPLVDVAALEKQKAEIDDKIEQHASNTASYQKNLADLRTEHTRLSAGIAQMESSVSAMDARMQELEGRVKCPYCKSNRQGWKDEYKQELETQIKELSTKITENKNQLALVTEEGTRIKADLAASEKADERHRTLATESKDLHNQIVLARKSATDRAALTGELTGLEQITKPSDTELETAAKDVQLLRAVVSGLEAGESAFTAFGRNQEKFRELEAKLIGHQVRVEVYKQAAKTVLDAQQEIVTRAFESILGPARRFTDGIIEGKLDYQHDELGVQAPAGWVSHKVLSGRGQDLAYLGLQVALAQQSPIKVVLVDEFGDFDPATKVKVINRLLELTREGFIDCACCADPRGEDYRAIDDKDFRLVELGK